MKGTGETATVDGVDEEKPLDFLNCQVTVEVMKNFIFKNLTPWPETIFRKVFGNHAMKPGSDSWTSRRPLT